MLGDLFSKYMKITKNCGSGTGCWNSGTTYFLSGNLFKNVDNRTGLNKIQLADGTTIAFGGLSSDCSKNRGNSKMLSSVCAWIVVDINGYRRPNTYGIDIFEFSLTKYGIVPYGTAEDTAFSFEEYCKNAKTAQGKGCTAWVLYNENLDYRYCTGLDWNGAHRCKDVK